MTIAIALGTCHGPKEVLDAISNEIFVPTSQFFLGWSPGVCIEIQPRIVPIFDDQVSRNLSNWVSRGFYALIRSSATHEPSLSVCVGRTFVHCTCKHSSSARTHLQTRVALLPSHYSRLRQASHGAISVFVHPHLGNTVHLRRPTVGEFAIYFSFPRLPPRCVFPSPPRTCIPLNV